MKTTHTVSKVLREIEEHMEPVENLDKRLKQHISTVSALRDTKISQLVKKNLNSFISMAVSHVKDIRIQSGHNSLTTNTGYWAVLNAKINQEFAGFTDRKGQQEKLLTQSQKLLTNWENQLKQQTENQSQFETQKTDLYEEIDKCQQKLSNFLSPHELAVDLIKDFRKLNLVEERTGSTAKDILELTGIKKFFYFNFGQNYTYIRHFEKEFNELQKNYKLLSKEDLLAKYETVQAQGLFATDDIFKITKAEVEKNQRGKKILDANITEAKNTISSLSKTISEANTELSKIEVEKNRFENLNLEDKVEIILKRHLGKDLASVLDADKALDFILSASKTPEERTQITSFMAQKEAINKIYDKVEEENIESTKFLNSIHKFTSGIEKLQSKLKRAGSSRSVKIDLDLIEEPCKKVAMAGDKFLTLSKQRIEKVGQHYDNTYGGAFTFVASATALVAGALMYELIQKEIEEGLSAVREDVDSDVGILPAMLFWNMLENNSSELDVSSIGGVDSIANFDTDELDKSLSSINVDQVIAEVSSAISTIESDVSVDTSSTPTSCGGGGSACSSCGGGGGGGD